MIYEDFKTNGLWARVKTQDGIKGWTKAGSLHSGLLSRLKYKTSGSGFYEDVLVVDEFLDFQSFASWATVQPGYNEAGWELDKDLLSGDVKVYSPSTCCFLPQVVNSALKGRTGQYLPGANKVGSRWASGVAGMRKTFATEEAAHEWYVAVKAQKLALLADRFEGMLDPRAYEALHNWSLQSRSLF